MLLKKLKWIQWKNGYKTSQINFRALQEAQEIFGVDFDYADFAQEDEYDEEMEEDVCIIILITVMTFKINSISNLNLFIYFKKNIHIHVLLSSMKKRKILKKVLKDLQDRKSLKKELLSKVCWM